MKLKIWATIGIILVLIIIIVFNQNSPTIPNFLGNNEMVNEQYDGFHFAIYMVDDELSKVEDSKDLNNIKLEDNPIICDNDILSYDFNEHTMAITGNCYKSLLDREDIFSKYFVVVAEGENIYLGMFRLYIHSFLPNTAIIHLDNLSGDSMVDDDSKVTLNIISPHSAPDMRSDPRIAKALRSLKK